MLTHARVQESLVNSRCLLEFLNALLVVERKQGLVLRAYLVEVALHATYVAKRVDLARSTIAENSYTS